MNDRECAEAAALWGMVERAQSIRARMHSDRSEIRDLYREARDAAEEVWKRSSARPCYKGDKGKRISDEHTRAEEAARNAVTDWLEAKDARGE